MTPLLEARSITKSFAGVHALNGVSFDLHEGEVHALIGENGAGKSTFIKIVTGAVTPDSGAITICGERIHHNSPARSRSLGVAAIYQQPALFPDLTVAENMALSLEKQGLWRKVDWQRRNNTAAEILQTIGSDIHSSRVAGSLSMPEQQIVEIAKAIGASARIVIMDEPTASLSDRDVEGLFRIVGSLRSRGVGIIYISHRLEEIFTIADRITVFRDGRNVATRDADEIDRAELIRLMVGRELSQVFPKRPVAIGEAVLEVQNLTCGTSGIRDVSFSVRRGEILGFAGLVGSGRTQLAESLFGISPADGGKILIGGKPAPISSPADAIRLGIAYVPEDRRRHGVIAEMPVTANVSLADLKAVSRQGLIQPAAEEELARTYATRFRIKTPSLDAPVGALSGGNQQKVALARWLAVRPSVLILDEPTQGVDVGSKAEIHELMGDLAEQGLAIIMISSELPEILGMSDRIAVMHKGSIARVLDRASATQENILEAALGHQPYLENT